MNTEQHPFVMGDTFHVGIFKVVDGELVGTPYVIVKTTPKTVTLQCGDAEPFVRRPRIVYSPYSGKRTWGVFTNDGMCRLICHEEWEETNDN